MTANQSEKPVEILEIISKVINAVDIGIHIVDTRGISIFYNQKAAGLDGLHPEEVIGRHVLAVFPSLTAESSTILEVLRTGRPVYNRRQVFYNFRGKKIVTLNSTIPVLVDGKPAGAAEISYDVTQVQEMADKLLDLQVELYRQGRAAEKAVEPGAAKYDFEQIIGESGAVRQLKQFGLRAARSGAPVFIYGETGTGKELLVHAIHNAGPRRHGPFITQNCAALPATLLEGILFGTVKGSFTGAENRPGLFELASGGTLFLDEINSADLELQAKLLRALEDGYVRRVGDGKNRPVDVRIIVASNILPARALAAGQIRPDLFYRLNVISLTVPPLRERREDIPLLARYFIKQFSDKLNIPAAGIAPEAMARLECYDWPGNVRQLKHLIEGILNLLETGEIRPEHLPPEITCGRVVPPGGVPGSGTAGGFLRPEATGGEESVLSMPEAVARLEKRLIVAAMAGASGNVAGAARQLGIPRQTLQYKLKSYGLK
ncbi:sigma-54 interaction domain-containing protein [Desulfotomaculum copahuensis]|uniref:Sigma-54-dependent Fis family transcriptional regulator n=1 Tax=Desulfotomaculum copahuensis TaxID=1838280 RepID=A0A1B7LI34_9FIRM|nr:sigma 54-interacting transcriptional regulator [Desulfotomaculum copahuensis]OAT86079.1 hypothetical protein A6M21_03905 [Desulfotomaculum copahuensis]